jgi:putative ubiquitin-RnfH superfamily antitoxin RatB of RatAB toxin-antitoxin module
MDELFIDAQVVYAQADRQILLNIRLPQGRTVSGAIEAAGIAAMISAGSIDGRQIGIFSRKVDLGHVVEQGDRIEIYRPLTIDPMDARRRRAR